MPKRPGTEKTRFPSSLFHLQITNLVAPKIVFLCIYREKEISIPSYSIEHYDSVAMCRDLREIKLYCLLVSMESQVT